MYINIVNDAALECAIKIFSSSDSKKIYAPMHHQTVLVPYQCLILYKLISQDIFSFAASCLGDYVTDNSKKSYNIIRKKYDRVYF